MKIFYHKIDLDGKSSAAILYQKFSDAELIGIDYGEDYDFTKIDKDEQIFIVDFSFLPEKMLQLKEKFTIVWIDHHITSIENSKKFKYDDIDGLREIDSAACELIWRLIHGTSCPYPIFLLGKYDLFKNDISEDILPFQYGMRIQNTDPKSNLWKKLLGNNKTEVDLLVENIISDGKILYKYEKMQSEKIVKSCSFEIKFEDCNVLCLNRSHSNSLIFESIYDPKKHDFVMLFYNFKNKCWNVKLYGGNGTINLGEIAQKYGGGGHKKAAGFEIDDIYKIIPVYKLEHTIE